MANSSQSKTKKTKLQFKTTLQSAGPKGAWTFLQLTPEQSAQLGQRSRVAVTGTLNGFPVRTSVAPMGDGTHAMVINKAMQAGAHIKAGDQVKVILEIDAAPRTVETPPDLKRALARDTQAKSFFKELSYTHQKDYVTWITSAKRPETRERRVEETVKLLNEGKKWQFR
ncbi:MAG: YdeI/OmpD-associated family protein [Pyrinomonadaceae bacterium]